MLNRKLYFSVFLIFICFLSKSQKYCNEWIDNSKTYFKFPITKEGIFRIDSATLATKFNLLTINPKQFQIFVKGEEQYLFIEGEADNQFNTNDYIEFYSNHYRREYDSLMYSEIKYLPNPYRPLINDTLYAYITVNTSVVNKRYQIETDSTIANYPLADYYYNELVYSPVSHYNKVPDYNNEASDARYTQSEGFGLAFAKGGQLTTPFANHSVFTGSNLPCYFNINLSGFSMNLYYFIDHQLQISYTNHLNNSVLLTDTAFYSYSPIRRSYVINNSQIGNNTNFNVLSVNNPSFSTFSNQTLLHYFQFKYPKTPTLSSLLFNKLFIDDNTLTTKQSFVLSNPNAGTTNSLVAYDISNGKKLPVYLLGGNARMVVPNSGSQKLVVVSAESSITNITQLNNLNIGSSFSNFISATANNPFVIIYHPSLAASANNYKTYRESSAGGAYQVISANINELYDHFGYGINKHPQAIRNFIKYLHDSLPTPPKYVLLIGKGIDYNYLSASSQTANLIPVFGIPSSDVLLTAGITNSLANYPEIPIGRIAALKDADVNIYLSKVQQHEATGQVEWKKKVLHFVGGDTPSLTNVLSSYMGSYEAIIEGVYTGAEVKTFVKNTTAPIQYVISDSIKDAINNGASLITFFGHGSSAGFDQAIDNPDDYNNAGKYPLVFANSCYSGDIFTTNNQSVSEKFVFANQKGAIGFLSSAGSGYASALHFYSTNFYQNMGVNDYGKGLGDFIKSTTYLSSINMIRLNRYQALDITLHGDPSIKIDAGLLPDYEIKNNYVRFDTKKYTDSIGIIINYKNIGKAVKDSFFVQIERYFANNDSITILKQVVAPYYKDSLKFYIPLDFVRGIGLNKFKVKLDQFNQTVETLKTNNATNGTVDLFIPGGDVVPVFPYKYAIVPLSNTITLKASTTDPFAKTATYKFQLDTCDKFTNPIQQTYITSSGGVLEWNVNLPFADSTVYFWRVSRDSVLSTDNFIWRESSFQTIGNKVGWSQAHFNQFKRNTYRFVKYNNQLRKFDFFNNVHSIGVRNGIYPNISPVAINFFFNGNGLSNWGCSPDGWNFAVFDSISGEPQSVVSVNWPLLGPGTYSNCVCVDNQVLWVYSFGQNNYCGFGNWKNDMQAFLNAVAPNNYILGYTMGALSPGYAQITTYNNALYTAFESFGSANIRTLSDTVPYIIFGRKGMNIGQANEVIGSKKSDIIYLNDSIKSRWNSGYIASEIIGPAFKWNSLHWQLKPYDALAGDTTILKVIGIKSNGEKDTLASFVKDSTDVLALYNYVNASTYPFVQLVAVMKDNINRTSPQLRKWQVLYDQVPECALNPAKGFVAINDSLMEGDVAKFRIPIENIGTIPFNDSLVVTYWLEDNNKVIHPLPQKLKLNNFLPGQIIYDTIALNSYQYLGNNAVWIYVNPPTNARYQKEQESFNNIGRLAFSVQKDITNPLLDVTFDGVRILNGDLVSAKPNILITLKDENKFLALNDTSAFSVSLKYPNQSNSVPIYFGNDLIFTPASLPNNSCKINFNPDLLEDGIYQLTVQGKDRSLNRSGFTEYRIQFEIKNKPSVTNVLNYPNPFSTSTRFVFTLTGSEIPEVFTIQIMTISGKVVKEITKEELGAIKIGRNITDYAWNGKDDFGDKLANGVYLYKVIIKLNNESIEKAETGTEKYFVKEFGKMVIMR